MDRPPERFPVRLAPMQRPLLIAGSAWGSVDGQTTGVIVLLAKDLTATARETPCQAKTEPPHRMMK